MGSSSDKAAQPDVLPRHTKKSGGAQPRHNKSGGDSSCCTCPRNTLAVILCIVSFVFFAYDALLMPEYTIAITGVSGLDHPVAPDTNRQGGDGVRLNPSFNLTVGVASWSWTRGACIDPKTVVEISYSHLLLPLASGNVPDVCVGRREASELRHVVASGRNVHVPGFLVDKLEEEMRNGEAIFKVDFITYDRDLEWIGGWKKVESSWVGLGVPGADGKRAGTAAVV